MSVFRSVRRSWPPGVSLALTSALLLGAACTGTTEPAPAKSTATAAGTSAAAAKTTATTPAATAKAATTAVPATPAATAASKTVATAAPAGPGGTTPGAIAAPKSGSGGYLAGGSESGLWPLAALAVLSGALAVGGGLSRRRPTRGSTRADEFDPGADGARPAALLLMLRNAHVTPPL